MSFLDAMHAAALDQQKIRPRYFAYLDINGDPIRVTTLAFSPQFAPGQTGDEDLDGFTFDAVDPRFIGVSDIKMKEGGGDTVSVTLSGILGVDDELMRLIGNKANWQGRSFRLWRVMVDENEQPIGGYFAYFTGYMTVPKIVGDRTSQTIVLDVETYLAFISAASNRSYLNQSDYDPDDHSAEASIAVANGTSGAALTGAGGGISAAMAAGGLIGATAGRIA